MARLHSDAVHRPHPNAAHGAVTAGPHSDPIVLWHDWGAWCWSVSAGVVGGVGSGVLRGCCGASRGCAAVLAADVSSYQVN